MSLDPRIEHALDKLLQKNLCAVHTGTVPVRETDKDGFADVSCTLPAGAVCLRWDIEKVAFNFLRDARTAADGALLVVRGDGSVEAHVMECKRTVDHDEWAKAKRQMRWSLARLRALAGVLGVTIDRTCCYIAYREETFSTDPGLVKLMLGDVDDPETRLLREQFDWPDATIDLGGYPRRWPHRKVRLDGAGHGSIDL